MEEMITPSELIEPAYNLTEHISFLLELLHCNGSIYYSLYDSRSTRLSRNNVPNFYDSMLRRGKIMDRIIDHADDGKPFMISTSSGLTWCAVYEKHEDIPDKDRIHLFGPTFSTIPSDDTIHKLTTNPNVSLRWRSKFAAHLRNAPVINATSLIKYTLMLHYTVTGQHLIPSDIVIDRSMEDALMPAPAREVKAADRLAMEDQMMSLIRTGDIYYKVKNGRAGIALQNIYPESDQGLKGALQQATIFIGLCIRAGIDGGLSPDTAFIKGENYLSDARMCENMVSILQLCYAVFDDFLHSVHNLQNSTRYSSEVQACIDYIEMHCAEEINIKHLAPLIGYTDYYLSRKFKNEVGMSINSYIKKARIDHAAYLLATTSKSIQEITDYLRFGNRSFFSKVFKDYMGITPVEYRNNHRHKL